MAGRLGSLERARSQPGKATVHSPWRSAILTGCLPPGLSTGVVFSSALTSWSVCERMIKCVKLAYSTTKLLCFLCPLVHCPLTHLCHLVSTTSTFPLKASHSDSRINSSIIRPIKIFITHLCASSWIYSSDQDIVPSLKELPFDILVGIRTMSCLP